MSLFEFTAPLGDEDEMMTVEVLHYSPGTPDYLAPRWEDSEQGDGEEVELRVLDGEGKVYEPTPAEYKTLCAMAAKEVM